ncbi:bZIP transcription factor 60-like [Nymphaea colorata]|nr:bZIP transcription factor 60-like [Nymphaea colorata]
MASEPLQFPPPDHDFLSDIPLDLEFPESLVQELGFEGDGFDFDLDDLILPPDADLELLANGFPSSWLNSGDSERSDSNPPVSGEGADAGAYDGSRSGVSVAECRPPASDLGGLSEAVVFKSENFSLSPESGCSSAGSISADFCDGLQNEAFKTGNNSCCSQEISHDEGNRSFIDSAESGSPLEREADRSVMKRKREERDCLTWCSGVKLQRPDCCEGADCSDVVRPVKEEEDKRTARLVRNRESAQLSRQRKKQYVEELESKVRSMSSTIAELNNRIACIAAENASLRQQLVSSCSQPNAYPLPQMTPMGFPWVPYPYALNPQNGIAFAPGSQVPLVPIPKLKTQQPASAPKVKKPSPKANSNEGPKKSGKATKKVASVTFICFLIFLMYFGNLYSVFNFMYGGNSDNIRSRSGYVESEFEGILKERVQADVGYVNGIWRASEGRLDPWGPDVNCSSLPFYGSETHVRHGNTSDSLVASLYIPRNNKLVRIDGHLIIQSVVASERSMEYLKTRPNEAFGKNAGSADVETEKTGLANMKDVQSTLPVPLRGKEIEGVSHFYRGPAERQRALASGSRDNFVEGHRTSSACDGPLQKWFSEGIAGPFIRSGMCTEVFRFEVSPTTTKDQTTIIPSGSSRAGNSSTHQSSNLTSSGMIRNRRFLYPTAIPLPGKTLHNTTSDYSRDTAGNKKGTFADSNAVSSSMVVSVLLDPRETGDSSNVLSSPKSLSRILVVVLVDSVKYVTYSCMLPFKSSSPHL